MSAARAGHPAARHAFAAARGGTDDSPGAAAALPDGVPADDSNI
jgi:hypothetical protein